MFGLEKLVVNVEFCWQNRQTIAIGGPGGANICGAAIVEHIGRRGMTLQFIDVKTSRTAEVLRRGCDAAASLLRETTGQPLNLAISHVDFLTFEAKLASAEIGEPPELVGASQDFDGDLSGQAYLLFEANEGLSLVRSLLRQHPEPDFMTEIDQSALTEIANIVINACLDDLAKGGRADLGNTVPVVVRGSLATVLRSLREQSAEAVITSLKIAFSLSEGETVGELIFLTPAERFAEFWRAAVRDIRIPVPLHG